MLGERGKVEQGVPSNEVAANWWVRMWCDTLRDHQAPQMVYCCHCNACQRITSSAFSMALILVDGACRLVKGEPKAVQRTGDSGRVTTRWMCPECGSWLCRAASPRGDNSQRARRDLG